MIPPSRRPGSFTVKLGPLARDASAETALYGLAGDSATAWLAASAPAAVWGRTDRHGATVVRLPDGNGFAVEPAFLMAVTRHQVKDRTTLGVALLDVSTGEFTATEYLGADGVQAFADELMVLRPREVIVGADHHVIQHVSLFPWFDLMPAVRRRNKFTRAGVGPDSRCGLHRMEASRGIARCGPHPGGQNR